MKDTPQDHTQDLHIVMPAELHRRFKVACIRDGYLTMKVVAVEIIQKYVERSEKQEAEQRVAPSNSPK